MSHRRDCTPPSHTVPKTQNHHYYWVTWAWNTTTSKHTVDLLSIVVMMLWPQQLTGNTITLVTQNLNKTWSKYNLPVYIYLASTNSDTIKRFSKIPTEFNEWHSQWVSSSKRLNKCSTLWTCLCYSRKWVFMQTHQWVSTRLSLTWSFEPVDRTRSIVVRGWHTQPYE